MVECGDRPQGQRSRLMATLTYTYTQTFSVVSFADPYKQCTACGGWVDGVLDKPGPAVVVPCEHEGGYRDVCPSWSPVDGCGCADYTARYPDDPISHPMRPRPTADDGKVY